MQTAHSSTCRTGEHPESEISVNGLGVCQTVYCGSRE